MLNVQILNEGINIVECDSVYITDPSNNIDNLIQRMSRSNRILKDKQECRIYLWCSEKKVNKIMNYINENTNNELVNKIFKLRFEKNKIIKEKYLNINTTTINEYDNIITYLKQKSSIDEKFIDDFYSYYNNNDYIINLEQISNWLEIRKDHLKTLLESNFIKDTDYITLNKQKNKGIGIGKNNIKTIMLKYSCAKELFMISKTKNASNIRKYLIELDLLILTYNK